MSSKPMQHHAGFEQRPEFEEKRNHFDLSHAHVSTFSMAKIIPFLVVETLPDDLFSISCEFFSRYARMYLPIMHRVEHHIRWFYIPYRILWPGVKNGSWEYFIYNDDSVAAPYLSLNVATVLGSTNSLPEYMGVPTPTTTASPQVTSITISAFAMSAYLKVYDEYYRNDQIQDERWFELTTGDNTAGFILAMTGFMPPFNANWNRDIYTSCTPTPQTGANVLVPMIRNATVDALDPAWTYLMPTKWKKVSDGTNAPIGALSVGVGGKTVDATGPVDVMLNIQETAATIRDLRYSIALTEFLERDMRAGDRYRDKHKAYWDIDPMPLLVDRPVYIGGKSGKVVISEVMSTANTETSDQFTYVGDYSGQALSLDSSRVVKYHAKEHGVIIGLINVQPVSMYCNGLHKMWSRDSRYDWPWPQFAHIGDEALLGKEVNLIYDATEDYNNVPWGYNRRYYDWTYHNDVIAGQMRDVFTSFHMARLFTTSAVTGGGVELNNEFITCTPDIDRAFQVNGDEGENEIYSYIWNEVHVLRKLPKYGIPSL